MTRAISNVLRVEIGGSPLAPDVAALLMRATVDDSLNVPDLFVLEFHDVDRTVLERTAIRIGSEIRLLAVGLDNEAGTPLISGEVTALEAEYDALGTRTIVRGFDKSHRLFRGRRTEGYTNTTFADVVRTVARRAGLETGRIDSTSAIQQLITQADQTDWQFLKWMAARVGFEVTVVDGRLEFRRPTAASGAPAPGDLNSADPIRLTLGTNLIRFRSMLTAAEQVPEVQVRSWDMRTKRALVGTAPSRAEGTAVGLSPADIASTFQASPHCAVHVPYDTQAEVDEAARALAGHVGGAFAQFEGVAQGSPRLKSGTAVSLGQTGAPFDGRYVLTSTRHTYDPHEGYVTSFRVTGQQDTSMVRLTSANGNGGSTGHAPTIAGVVVAQVTDVRDPDDLGRVKVNFPWLSETYVSDWCRVSQFDAGGHRRGAMFLPEVDDEVLIAFEHGDMRRPFVVGRLFNAVDRHPGDDHMIDSTSGAVARRGYQSREHHALVFFDAPRAQGVGLHSGDRTMKISINQSDHVIRLLCRQGDVEIEAQGEVTIKAGTNLKLEAGTQMELRAPNIRIAGSGPVEVSGTPIRLN